MNPRLPTLAIAYLLGSIPFGYLLVRVFRKQDIRSLGSGNIGATNVLRSGAKGLGIATLLLDCLKGAVAVLLAFQIARHALLPRPAAFDLACAAAVAAVLGHVFPVWLGFRGGKGVATALGVFLVLSPPIVGCAVLVFLLVFALSRYVSLASILAAATVAALFLLSTRNSWTRGSDWYDALQKIHRTPWTAIAFLLIPLLVIAKHHGNIRRLLAGTENRFGGRKAVA